MIRLIDISKIFSKKYILNGIHLELGKTRIVVCGSMGAGKTTLLRIIAGLILPTHGKVLLDKSVISTPRHAVHPSLRGIAMVFQNPVLWPHMTVSNSINFVLSAQKTRRKERTERVSEIIKAFNLYPIRNHRPNKLSGGEKKKVSLAIAIAAKARFLLLDEPFENIDEEQQEEIMSILLELFNTQKIEGMLCVTHNQSVAATLGERVLYLKNGVLVEQLNKKPMNNAG